MDAKGAASPQEVTLSTMPNGDWAPWARWLIALLVVTLLANAALVRSDVSKMQSQQAVHEERWRLLDQRLGRIEADISEHHATMPIKEGRK